MKKKKILTVAVSLLLLVSIAFNLAGCTSKVYATDLMDGIIKRAVTRQGSLEGENAAVTDFAVRLFKSVNTDEDNIVLSPISVLCALAMTANGEEGETRKQMESALGMSVDALNLYLYSYMASLPQGDKYKLSLANSIWFTEDERFAVSRDFLQLCADYYGAAAYQSPFNRRTVNDINNWVKNNTDGMIKEVIDSISPDAVMYLVNALAFEAEWSQIYEDHQVRNGKFTKLDGTDQNVEFMYSTEGKYIEGENETGFIKYYKGGKYAFAALLPNDSSNLSDYVIALDGETLRGLLTNAESKTVNTAIPKFETDYGAELSGALKSMGMTHAFDMELADFSSIGASDAGNVHIGQVIHKTYIQLGESGTRAGAVTVVTMKDMGTDRIEDPKTVYLDRPFVYMLIDCENSIPFFIGTVTDVNG